MAAVTIDELEADGVPSHYLVNCSVTIGLGEAVAAHADVTTQSVEKEPTGSDKYEASANSPVRVVTDSVHEPAIGVEADAKGDIERGLKQVDDVVHHIKGVSYIPADSL